MKAPRPDNEAKRLDALERYRLLDTLPEQAYDDITALASCVCGTPVAFISLVAEGRQWFKSRIGIDAAETSRDISFCAHTILGQQVMVVPDATQDMRFAGSPLTQSIPHIRFYAGMPLVTPEGFSIGALCVVDREPRTLTPDQTRALTALGRQVVQLLELRRVSTELAQALVDLKTLKGLLPICAYCKRVRDDAGYWSELEAYVHEHTDADFTHGICPTCTEHYFGEQAAPSPTSPDHAAYKIMD